MQQQSGRLFKAWLANPVTTCVGPQPQAGQAWAHHYQQLLSKLLLGAFAKGVLYRACCFQGCQCSQLLALWPCNSLCRVPCADALLAAVAPEGCCPHRPLLPALAVWCLEGLQNQVDLMQCQWGEGVVVSRGGGVTSRCMLIRHMTPGSGWLKQGSGLMCSHTLLLLMVLRLRVTQAW